MKPLLALLLSLFSLSVFAESLSFNIIPSGGNPDGYLIYGSPFNLNNANRWTAPIRADCGTNLIWSLTPTNTVTNTWFFAVAAYYGSATNGIESELTTPIPVRWPPPPQNVVVLIPQYNTTLLKTNWQDIGFFRIKLGLP